MAALGSRGFRWRKDFRRRRGLARFDRLEIEPFEQFLLSPRLRAEREFALVEKSLEDCRELADIVVGPTEARSLP